MLLGGLSVTVTAIPKYFIRLVAGMLSLLITATMPSPWTKK